MPVGCPPCSHGASASSTAYPTCFPLTQFTCNNGRCININWRCDNGEDPALHCSRGDGETRGGGAACQGPHFGNLGPVLIMCWRAELRSQGEGA